MDATGQAVWRWEAGPFGNGVADEDPDGNGQKVTFNLRLPGQYLDAETGLHYNYHRDYDPGTGRYREGDPIGLVGGLNLYGYVGGDPINRIDPDGRWFWWAVGAGLTLWDMFKPIELNLEYPDAIEPVDTLPGPLGLGKTAKKASDKIGGVCRRFDIDPRDLVRPPSQPEADPFKLADQIRKYGNSINGMPPVLVRSFLMVDMRY